MRTIKGGRRVMRTMGRNREGWELLKVGGGLCELLEGTGRDGNY